MTIYARYKIILLFLFTCCGLAGNAQQVTIVKATPDRTKILIGEPIRIELVADIPENQGIRFFQFDSIPHFEYLNREKIDTSNSGQGTVLRQFITITSFDSGRWVIPPFMLADNTATDSMVVEVTFSPFNPEQPYHDIKDILEVETPKQEEEIPWLWVGIAAAVLVGIIIFIIYLRRKPAPPPPVEKPADPYQKAVAAIDALRGREAEAKTYYSGLADTFRMYVSERHGLDSLQRTTEDLVRQLRNANISAPLFESLAKALRLSDFVKFAKYEPTQQDASETMTVVRETIDNLESEYRIKEQKQQQQQQNNKPANDL